MGGETVYAITKSDQERLVLAWGRQTGVPTVALRYSCTYGPRQSVFNPYTGVIAIFATRLLNGQPPVLYEDGEQTRDLCYVGVLDVTGHIDKVIEVLLILLVVVDAATSGVEDDLAGRFADGVAGATVQLLAGVVVGIVMFLALTPFII